MRLYTTTGASSVHHPEHGDFDIDEAGAVEVPEEFGRHLHGTHIGGRPAWETEAERHARLTHEELERRRDPETLLKAVEQLGRHSEPEEPAEPVDVQALVEKAVQDALEKQKADFDKLIADAQREKAEALAALEQATQPPAEQPSTEAGKKTSGTAAKS